MFSQNASEAFLDDFEQWDKQFISDFYNENQSSDNSSHVNVSENEEVHNSLHQQNTISFATENVSQNNIQVDISSLLSPPWDNKKVYHTRDPTTINMSTYFSTFNPVQPNSQLPYPVRNRSSQIQQYQQNYNKALEKIHRARVNLVPSSVNFKAVTKRKRKRTMFTSEQVEALESVFLRKPYVTRDERQILVNQLKLSDKSVKIWFQNRRLKGKREDSDSETQDSITSKLDDVESKIIERTNEFGYVTLDDKIMNDLYEVVDEYLKRTPVKPSIVCMEIDNNSMYEPISPASTSDDNVYECSVVSYEDTIQQLVDIDSIISVRNVQSHV